MAVESAQTVEFVIYQRGVAEVDHMPHDGGDEYDVAVGLLSDCGHHRAGAGVVCYLVEQREQTLGRMEAVETAYEHRHVDVIAQLGEYALA